MKLSRPILLPLLLVLASAANATAQDVEGVYRLDGRETSGHRFWAEINVQASGGGTYRVTRTARCEHGERTQVGAGEGRAETSGLRLVVRFTEDVGLSGAISGLNEAGAASDAMAIYQFGPERLIGVFRGPSCDGAVGWTEEAGAAQPQPRPSAAPPPTTSRPAPAAPRPQPPVVPPNRDPIRDPIRPPPGPTRR